MQLCNGLPCSYLLHFVFSLPGEQLEIRQMAPMAQHLPILYRLYHSLYMCASLASLAISLSDLLLFLSMLASWCPQQQTQPQHQSYYLSQPLPTHCAADPQQCVLHLPGWPPHAGAYCSVLGYSGRQHGSSEQHTSLPDSQVPAGYCGGGNSTR